MKISCCANIVFSGFFIWFSAGINVVNANEEYFEYVRFGPESIGLENYDDGKDRMLISHGGIATYANPNPDFSICEGWRGPCLFVDSFKFAVPRCSDETIHADTWSLGGVSFSNFGVINANRLFGERVLEIHAREMLDSENLNCGEGDLFCALVEGRQEKIVVFKYSCKRGLLGYGFYLGSLLGHGRVFISTDEIGAFSQTDQ